MPKKKEKEELLTKAKYVNLLNGCFIIKTFLVFVGFHLQLFVRRVLPPFHLKKTFLFYPLHVNFSGLSFIIDHNLELINSLHFSLNDSYEKFSIFLLV